MNIPNNNHKFTEKSRSFFTGHLMNRQINVFLFVTAIVILALIIINQTHKITNEPKRIDITISPHTIHLFGKDTMDTLIQEFEEQNPGLRIQTAASENVDIVFFDDGEYNSFMNDSYIRTETLMSFMDVFVYNIDILKAASRDRPPKSRAEFLDAAKAVAKNNTGKAEQEQVYPFALGLSQADPAALRRDFYPWVWMGGGDIYSIDVAAGPPALPRPVTDTIAFFGQLNREGLLAPGTFEKTGAQRLEEFAAGKIAMMTTSVRDIAFLRNSAQGINFDITSVPANNLPGRNRIGLSGIYAGINSDCVLPDEASIFLAFMAEKRHILAEALGAVPGSFPGVFSGEYIAQDPLYSKAWDIFQMADIIEQESEQTPNPSFETEVNRILREKLVEAFQK